MRRDVFQAIADPTRRAILTLLAVQALTPNALAEHFSSSRQAVSKHLQVLSECELVTTRQSGREVHYQLNPEKMKEIDEWLSQFRKLWETRFNELDQLLIKLQNKNQ
ncbi:MAG: metalloregulator ArsR/SmtB family transcription factor [Bacteroidia bacterium]|nr:metalloregulator ArsR/SmtB family transcription factor [Bacteroidia bacterium]